MGDKRNKTVGINIFQPALWAIINGRNTNKLFNNEMFRIFIAILEFEYCTVSNKQYKKKQ